MNNRQFNNNKITIDLISSGRNLRRGGYLKFKFCQTGDGIRLLGCYSRLYSRYQGCIHTFFKGWEEQIFKE